MLLFVGLGNPGRAYARNRHNIGYMAVDAIASAHRVPPFRVRFKSLASEAVIGQERVILLKPETYMNEFGRAVGEAMRFYKIPLSGIIVFHDELDLPPGRVRVKVGGGNAGHNGLRSISENIGNDYRRVRIGIGHPGDKDRVYGYVLSDFGKAEFGLGRCAVRFDRGPRGTSRPGRRCKLPKQDPPRNGGRRPRRGRFGLEPVGKCRRISRFLDIG